MRAGSLAHCVSGWQGRIFHVISGRLRITSHAGDAREFGPGDACVIPAGFEGVFEVLEPVRKHFVVIDRNAG